MNPAPPPAIFEQVAWQLRYGVPAERRRAATQLIALSEQQPPEVRHHVETLLWEQSQREPHADLRSFLQTAALRFKVARFRGAHSTRSDRRLAMGSIVRTLRIKAGLSTTALCARCGLHRDSLRYMERGVREEPLANYLKVFHALAGHVTPVLRVRFYEQWNMELRELPWYDWKAHRYEVRLPDGWTIEEALAKTPGEVIALRIDSLKLSRPRLVIESGLKRWRLWDLIHGRLKRPPLALLRQLAPMLQLDASLLYLLAHPEIPGFVAVVESDKGTIHTRRGPRRFDPAWTRLPAITATRDGRSAVERLGLHARARYRQVVERHVRYDRERDEAYILLPSAQARAEAETMNVAERLKAIVHGRGLSQRAFFAQSPLSFTSFRAVATGRAIPAEEHLRWLSATLGIAEASILYTCLRRVCGDRIAARIAPGP